MALPTALQWEILCVYVGTHVVRNNRLRRRFTGKIQKEILDSTIKYSEYRRHQIKVPLQFYLNKIPWLSNYNIVSMLHFSEGGKRILLENKMTGKMSYWYICSDRWACVHMADAILPPYIKHVYPSWASTDKKKGTVWQKVYLYDPRKNNPNYLGFGSDS